MYFIRRGGEEARVFSAKQTQNTIGSKVFHANEYFANFDLFWVYLAN